MGYNDFICTELDQVWVHCQAVMMTVLFLISVTN